MDPTPMLYAVLDESGQRIATTATRWTAERLIEGIKAHDSPTSKLGSWSIKSLDAPVNCNEGLFKAERKAMRS